jgi:hypothetical protein
MKAMVARGVVLGLAALAAGCTSNGTTAVGGAASAAAEVTRFHLGQNIARGEIAIEPLEPAEMGSMEFGRHAAAVERQLTALGWRVVRGNTRSEQVAVVRVGQGTREQMRRSGLSLGFGGGVGGGGVGAGGGVQVPIGGGRGQIVVTELAVRLQRRSAGSAIWEGRARTEARAGTAMADRAAAVDRLAPALFQGFPGESGRTIRVQ